MQLVDVAAPFEQRTAKSLSRLALRVDIDVLFDLGVKFSENAAGRPKIDLNSIVLVAKEQLRGTVVACRNISDTSFGKEL